MPKTALTKVIIDPSLVEQADQHCPTYMPRTVFINQLVQEGLDLRNRMGKPTAREVLPLKGFNKEEDVEFSLRAEEAHISVAAIKSPPKRTNEIPGNLFAHEELIRNYWKVKPSAKSAQAWKLMTTELTKIQDQHGDSVVRDQLIQAEANRWKGVTLFKYEQFGMPRSNTATKASSVDWAAVEAMGSMF